MPSRRQYDPRIREAIFHAQNPDLFPELQIPRFTLLESRMVPLLIDDVDTDQIIPAEFLKATGRGDFGDGLFAAWRRDPDFVLHSPASRGARVLLAGENFGCGSSREHAPWALLDYGFRAVVSPRFADIFRANALRNGLLTVAVDGSVHRRLAAAARADASAEVTIDLEAEQLTLPDGSQVPFEVDPFARRCLLEGVDQLGYLLRQRSEIEAYEARHPSWVDTTLRVPPSGGTRSPGGAA